MDDSYKDWRLLNGPSTLMQIYEASKQQSWPPKVDTSKMDLDYWKKTWEGAKAKPDITLVDKHPYGAGVQGWTLCDKDNRTCQVIIKNNADYDRVRLHEYMHALGWDHPNHLQHLLGYESPLSFK